jgi:ribonuclease R
VGYSPTHPLFSELRLMPRRPADSGDSKPPRRSGSSAGRSAGADKSRSAPPRTRGKRPKLTRPDGRPELKPMAEHQRHHEDLTPVQIEKLLLATLLDQVKDSLNVKQLLMKSHLDDQLTERDAIELLQRLAGLGKVEETSNRRYRADQRGLEVTGKVEHPRDGAPFVTAPDLGEPVMLPPLDHIGAFVGDTVRVTIGPRKKGVLRAEACEVVKRAREDYVGTLLQTNGRYSFNPQDGRIKPDFFVSHKDIAEGKPGDRVVVQLTQWHAGEPQGKVVRVLGAAGTHQAEMHAIVAEFGLHTTFDPAVEDEANAYTNVISKKDLAARRDFRKILTFTIDPPDAKDFDDAISFRKLDDGTYEIGVHIADVSHYVKPGTLLDEEGIERATSVYLVDRTIPMLPEHLSNNLCSLVPNQDRLVFSAVFVFSPDGMPVSEWFGRGVIHSDRRFAYDEVQQILDQGFGEHVHELTTLNRIAHALRKERFANGSIGFETDEIKFQLDANFKPIGVYKKVRKDAHKLIEDFMLLANRQVARFVAKARKKPEVPMVYRVHDIPSAEKLATLKTFVGTFGYRLNTDRDKVSSSLNKLVVEATGKPEEGLIQTVAIRSMPKAIYTTHNMGHYGLGFEYYTHFTSPIRRYPDVLSHRILQLVLDGQLNDPLLTDPDALEALCKHCSDREKRAAEAERASIKFKQVEFLEGLLGTEHEGIISGVTEWGMYVELEANKCEGMVPLRELHDDHYELDPATYTLRGRKRGRTFRLGDRVRVKVHKTNLVRRTADFRLISKL